jgi:hypothetical protein
VPEHVIGNRSRVRVLQVRIEVELDDAVSDRRIDLLGRRAASAVEDEVELGIGTEARDDGISERAQDLRPELCVHRPIDTVDVSEGGGEEVSAALTGSQALDNGDGICRRAVETLVCDTACIEPVLLAADDPNLDLEDHVRVSAFLQELGGQFQVLGERKRGAVEHVRLVDGRLVSAHPRRRLFEQRPEKGIDLHRRTVVGVQCNQDGIVARHLACEGRQRSRPCSRVHRPPGRELGTARSELNDPVRARVRETGESSIERR